ncbi:hypothetical protein Scep_001298 [Stephania cephalantha]|uniref:Uncharacterized protein n=1 Tax=Stephania cephalantha TaxID=152367 RepID=A0AAP0L7M5_9MAGN
MAWRDDAAAVARNKEEKKKGKRAREIPCIISELENIDLDLATTPTRIYTQAITKRQMTSPE